MAYHAYSPYARSWGSSDRRIDSLSLASVSLSQWNRFLGFAPSATPFHRYEYLQFVSRLNQVEFLPMGVFCQQQLVGLFPIIRFRRGPFRIAGSPVSFAAMPIPYLGPVIDDDLLFPALQCFDAWVQREHVDYSELRTAGALPHLSGWETETLFTVILELPRDVESLVKNLSPTCRTAIRKAQKEKVEVCEITQEQFFLEDYSTMADDVYRRWHRRPPKTPAYFTGLFRLWHESGRVRVLSAKRSGLVIAAAVFLLNPETKTAYYLDGVSHTSTNQLRPNNAIQWEMLQYLVQAKYRRYDMLGGSVAGIRRFKLTFGGRLVPYSHAFRSRNLWVKLARLCYRPSLAVLRKTLYVIGNTFSKKRSITSASS